MTAQDVLPMCYALREGTPEWERYHHWLECAGDASIPETAEVPVICDGETELAFAQRVLGPAKHTKVLPNEYLYHVWEGPTWRLCVSEETGVHLLALSPSTPERCLEDFLAVWSKGQ